MHPLCMVPRYQGTGWLPVHTLLHMPVHRLPLYRPYQACMCLCLLCLLLHTCWCYASYAKLWHACPLCQHTCLLHTQHAHIASYLEYIVRQLPIAPTMAHMCPLCQLWHTCPFHLLCHTHMATTAHMCSQHPLWDTHAQLPLCVGILSFRLFNLANAYVW